MKMEDQPPRNPVRRRFFRIWALFAGFYTLLALVGPNGLLPSFIWPDNNQHSLQARAWLGEDIDVESVNPDEALHIDVDPRLDVTPYFEHRVIVHPRDKSMLANLADRKSVV